jgi:ABC-2 type transport system ATP-binding protein
VLILDEPTAGVDVEIRRSMWDFLRELNEQGVTIILTTHYLEEAESMCRHIAILNQGKIIKQTSMKELLAEVSTQMLILESLYKLPNTIKTTNFEAIRLDDYSLQIALDKGVSVSFVLQMLSQQGIEIDHVRSSQNRLERLFLNLTTQY